MANCPKCGKPLVLSNKVSCNGVSYCRDCLSIVIQEEKKQEQKRQELYGYIKKIYEIDYVPEVVEDIIKNLIEKKEKTYNGIQKTLYYYYEILEKRPRDITKFRWVILSFYEETKQYLIKQKEIMKRNQEFVDNAKIVTYKIDADELFKPKKKNSINIEDL